jgi:hypothetical protein
MVLLFVDLLGVKARWVKGGRAAAGEAFQKFWNLIAYVISDSNADAVRSGLIESDSAAIVCEDAAAALKIAQHLYLSAFTHKYKKDEWRLWLRGVIIPKKGDGELRTPTDFKTGSNVHLMRYSDDLIEAIHFEKCGFKGMRLLVSDELITGELRSQIRVSIGNLHIAPIRKLSHSGYPSRIEKTVSDFLWMVTPSETENRRLEIIMASSLRKAARDPEELLQAAATQIVFHEVSAIYSSLKLKSTNPSTRTNVEGLQS